MSCKGGPGPGDPLNSIFKALLICLLISMTARVGAQRLVFIIDPNDCRKSFLQVREAVNAFDGRMAMWLGVQKSEMDFMMAALRNEGLLNDPRISLEITVKERRSEFGSVSYYELWIGCELKDSGPLDAIDRINVLLEPGQHSVQAKTVGDTAHVGQRMLVLSPRTELYGGDTSVLAVDYLLNVAYEISFADTGIGVVKRFGPELLSWDTSIELVQQVATIMPSNVLQARERPGAEIRSAHYDASGWRLCMSQRLPQLRGQDTAWIPFQFDVDPVGRVKHLAWEDLQTSSRCLREIDIGWISGVDSIYAVLTSMDDSAPLRAIGHYVLEVGTYQYRGMSKIQVSPSENAPHGPRPPRMFASGDNNFFGTRNGGWLIGRDGIQRIEPRALIAQAGYQMSWLYDVRDRADQLELLFASGDQFYWLKLAKSPNNEEYKVVRVKELGSVVSCAQFLQRVDRVIGFSEKTRRLEGYQLE